MRNMCGILVRIRYRGQRALRECVSHGHREDDESRVEFDESGTTSSFPNLLRNRGPDYQQTIQTTVGDLDISCSSSVLHLRGGHDSKPVQQPFISPETGNILLWNGEMYNISSPFTNDTQHLSSLLDNCANDPTEIVSLLSNHISGPFSLVYIDIGSKTVFYGRDRIGRRSLVFAWEDSGNTLVLSSLAVGSTRTVWNELGASCVYSVQDLGSGRIGYQEYSYPPTALSLPGNPDMKSGEIFIHFLEESIRSRLECLCPDTKSLGVLFSGGIDCTLITLLICRYLDQHDIPMDIDLLNVVYGDSPEKTPDRQTSINSLLELQAVLGPCSGCRLRLVEIDLTLEDVHGARERIMQLLTPSNTVMDFNIASVLFHASRGKGKVLEDDCHYSLQSSELCRYASGWTELVTNGSANGLQSVETLEEPMESVTQANEPIESLTQTNEPIDSLNQLSEPIESLTQPNEPLESLNQLTESIESLTQPNEPIESLNQSTEPIESLTAPILEKQLYKAYETKARILFSGLGADELLGGYGRHRTVYRKCGEAGLAQELAKDQTRLWKRNLGRDDRVISHWGREVRYPFLDQSFITFCQSLSVSELCDLSLPPGLGDKKVQRQAALALGLSNVSSLQKRAIQFGTRIANKKVAGYVPLRCDLQTSEITAAPLSVQGQESHTAAYLSKKQNKRRNKPNYE